MLIKDSGRKSKTLTSATIQLLGAAMYFFKKTNSVAKFYSKILIDMKRNKK
jgi:hypothetical protein